MFKRWIITVGLLLGAVGAAVPATQPAEPGSLEFRAVTALNRGDYASALPLLEKLAEQNKDQSKKGLIDEQIRVAKAQIAAAATQPAEAGGDVQIPMSAEARKKHAAPTAGEVRELGIQELGNFEYDADKGGNIPADVTALSGSKVRVRGFMIPMDQTENITQFALVPSLFACCYGQPPQVQHTVVCETPKGKAVSYFPDEIQVEGTLKVQEKRDEGFIVSVFELEVSSVKPAVK
jgi:hypothetical protein